MAEAGDEGASGMSRRKEKEPRKSVWDLLEESCPEPEENRRAFEKAEAERRSQYAAELQDLYRRIRSVGSTDYNRYKRLGVYPDEYQSMLSVQKGLCAICGKEETSTIRGKVRQLAVDHCHTTGKIRGLLCGNCNRALGLLKEEPDRVKSMLKYIEERCLLEEPVRD